MVEVGRTLAGGGMERKGDRVLGRLVACLDVRAVERYDRLRWQTAGGEAGGQMRVAVAEVDGLALGLKEVVSDGITSTVSLMLRKEYPETRTNKDSRKLGASLVRQMTTAKKYRVFPEGGSPRDHVAQGLPVGQSR